MHLHEGNPNKEITMKRKELIIAMVATLALTTSACTTNTEPDLSPEDLPDTLSGIIYDEQREVVPGVEICVYEREEIPCATTNDKGQYDLRLPNGEDIVIRYAKDGFVPKLRMHRTQGAHWSFWQFQRRAHYVEQAARLDLNWDDSAAIVTAQSDPGVMIMLDPQAGVGPFYTDEEFNIDPELTETTNTGVGAYVNVPPGTYLVGATTMGGSYSSCEADAWTDVEGVGEVIAVAGHLTWTGMSCE